ncbi:MAG: flavin reductase family protein [Rhodospirillales bacterium]|nr:flavin reductase family protein [Alphaproteobacteria bacterium]MBL6948645.1 flavin reductase family protein [Rhodospirillales bacterium]
MFHKIGEPHGLPHDPFKSCVVPRPIGWISTLSADGIVNLAPYSFFNALAAEPPMVMFSTNGKQPFGPKDSLTNVEATGEFVCSMATWNLRDAMNRTSAPEVPEINEFDVAGLEMEPSVLVKPPRVKASPIHLECLYHTTVELPCDIEGGRNAVCIGRVIGVHIRDEVLTDGKVDIARIRPLARLGYQDYTVAETVFPMAMPK